MADDFGIRKIRPARLYAGASIGRWCPRLETGGGPQSALVGIAVTSTHDVIFDTGVRQP